MKSEVLETFKELPPQQQAPRVTRKKWCPSPLKKIEYVPAGKLKGKVAIITGGGNGSGRSVAIQFAKEGADICIFCLSEKDRPRKDFGRLAMPPFGMTLSSGGCYQKMARKHFGRN